MLEVVALRCYVAAHDYIIHHRGEFLELYKQERAIIHQLIHLLTDHSYQSGGTVFGDGTDTAITRARRRLAELDDIIETAHH